MYWITCRSGNLCSGLLAGVEAAIERKPGDHRTDHPGRPTSAIVGDHQGIGETVKRVKRRGPPVSEYALINLPRTGIHECGDESEVTILGCYPASSAMGGFLQLQVALAQRQHLFAVRRTPLPIVSKLRMAAPFQW